MGKPHPMELRSRVVEFVEEGHSNRQASRYFPVSPRFVNNLINLKAETGSLAACRQGHGVGLGKLSGRCTPRLTVAGYDRGHLQRTWIKRDIRGHWRKSWFLQCPNSPYPSARLNQSAEALPIPSRRSQQRPRLLRSFVGGPSSWLLN